MLLQQLHRTVAVAVRHVNLGLIAARDRTPQQNVVVGDGIKANPRAATIVEKQILEEVVDIRRSPYL